MDPTRLMPAACLLALVAAASGQLYQSGPGRKAIDWSRNAEQSIEAARKSKRPLMLLVLGDSERRDDRLDDDRRKAMMDERVIYAARRFIPVQVVRSDSRLRGLFERLSVPESANMDVVFATPDGTKLDTFSAIHVPDTFAQKMTLVFAAYRRQLFETELKAVLDDRAAKSAAVRDALKLIEEFTIEEAAPTVLDMLERWKSDPAVVRQCLETLGALSTPQAVDRLFELASAPGGKSAEEAAAALEKCTPAAAEKLLEKLNAGQPQERLTAYRALTKICKIKGAKPDRFWEGTNERAKQQELERVSRAVEKAAQRWRDTYGQYR